MKSSRRFIKVSVVLALLILVSPLKAVAPLPWLHTEGNKIKDPDGNDVVLRGFSLIDLGFLEYWQGGAINMINRLTDKSDAQGNSPGWYTKAIRIPIVPKDASDGTWPIEFDPNNLNDPNNLALYNLLKSVVNQCASKGVYSIIDWHYVADTCDHTSSTNTFWQYMASRFTNDSNVMFELFNEPINTEFGSESANWASVKANMETWTDTVRTYAPKNIILVGGPQWCQVLAPQASNPIAESNIVYVSHIYPYHWENQQWYIQQITTCAAVYPILMTEWGMSTSGSPDSNDLLNGTIAGYGQPLSDFREELGIGNTAWVASYDWGPPMFWDPGGWPKPAGPWPLRIGEGEMGGFTKDLLYLLRNDNQPAMPPQTPYGGVAWAIPGILEAEDYDVGGPNVAYYDTTNGNSGGQYRSDNVDIETCSEGGFDVTGIQTGEWLEYTVDVESTGIYDIEARVAASGSGGSFHILVGTTNVTGTVSVPATGGGQTFTSVLIPNVPLKGGRQIMRLLIDAGGFNLNYINITKAVPTGTVLREWWTGITGTSVSNLTSNPNYPNNPTGREVITKLEGPLNWADNYGTRIRGYLNPPATGSYTFWIASDDSSELWLSTDTNPSNATKIAYVSGWTNSRQWDKYDVGQRSSLRTLTTGQKYYIEVLHKEGTGGDNVAVAWQGPGLNQQLIEGVYLSAFLYPDFRDFAFFAKQWRRTDCTIANGWCSGADMDHTGSVLLDDLQAFANGWLIGAE